MAVIHIKLGRISELCLIVISISGIYFLGLWTQPHKYEVQQLEVQLGQDLHASEIVFLANSARKSQQARRNLIIVSHGRSGSTLMGDIFNHHPSVFYMYEPLQTAERVVKNSSGNMSYSGLVNQFLTGVFRCQCDHPQIVSDIERYYRKPDHPGISQAIASPPLCPYRTTDPRWDPQLCYPMTSESLGSACMENYNLTAIKVLMDRIPENTIKTILTTFNPLDVDCKVVFLV